MIKILICDDETFARDAMAKIIKRKGFEVIIASTGAECIEIFKKEQPNVVFLDVMLPDLDGDHVHNYLKEIKADTHVYYITGSDTVFTKENANTAGAKGYLQKPVDINALFETLDNIKKDFGE
ncbi:MAG: response regulator [Elusimicrobia bacterium]|nr:response regulator [Elusimicrobiota bacterium]